MNFASTDFAIHSAETVLYSISAVLYLPVLLAIIALTLYLLLSLGAYTAEFFERRRGLRALVRKAEERLAAVLAASHDAPTHAGLEARLENIVQQAERDGMRKQDAVRFAIRLGPALGLMGTLIPMGISLAGLAQGNLPKMAESMTTAFTATVVGLACSVLAYLLSLVREHWLRRDIGDVAFMAESALAGSAVARPAMASQEI